MHVQQNVEIPISVRTSQRKLCVCIRKKNLLVICREINTVHCANHLKITHKCCSGKFAKISKLNRGEREFKTWL